MSEQHENTHRRQDRLLRRWGAEEAAREADVDHLAAPVPRRAQAGPFLLRWLPLAASLVLVAGAASLFFAGGTCRMAPEAGPDTTAKLTGQLESVRAKLTRENEHLRTTLAASEARFKKQEEELKQQLERLRRKADEGDAELFAELVKARQHIADLNRDISEKQAALKMAGDLVLERERELTALQQRSAEMAAAQNELRAALDSARREMEKQLAAAAALRAAEQAMLRRTYFAASAPGETGVRARQVAARTNRLVRRCGQLRKMVRSREARELFDTLEVLLTRLDLLDTGDGREVESFGGLLRRAKPVGRVEEALLAGGEEPAVHEWLIEVQLVLTGV